jgi:lipid-binding SYLF domain-containing protein
MTRQGVENMKKGKFTIGADVSATAGPVGRSAEASTDIQMKSEIYSYARSRGLFIGASLEGTSLRIDNQSNARFYKNHISADDIFNNKVENPPPIVNEFLQTISKITGAQPLTSLDSTETSKIK